jgi:hypothetical protein
MRRLPTAAALAVSLAVATPVSAQPAPAGGAGHAAALLPDRSIVVTGGDGTGEIPSPGAFLYAPDSAVATATGSMALPRTRHTATPLASGLVVLIGGNDGYGGMGSIEIFDPATSAFRTSGAVLEAPREGHEAIGLGGTRILIRGGRDRDAQVALDEVYDLATDAVEPAPARSTSPETSSSSAAPDGPPARTWSSSSTRSRSCTRRPS